MFSLSFLMFACTLETGLMVDTGTADPPDDDVADSAQPEDTGVAEDTGVSEPEDTAVTDTALPDDTGDPVDTSVPSTATCQTAPDSSCQIRSYDGRDYLFCTDELDWHSAQTACEAMGTGCHLATASSEPENDYLFAELAALFGGFPDYWWFGLTEGPTENSWAWVDGSPYGYTDWGVNEPNDLGGEDCGHLFTGYQGWNDISCSNTYAYVCEAG